MAELCINIPDELKKQAEVSNIDLSKLLVELAKREIIKKELLKRFNSKEEQELIKWSVDLGKKAKKGRFKQLLKEVSPDIREKLLNSMTPKKEKNINKLK
ncbi:MAG: hypothetical protein ABIH37_03875 [archaeon]